jgi:hypothetical protein
MRGALAGHKVVIRAAYHREGRWHKNINMPEQAAHSQAKKRCEGSAPVAS